MNPYVFSNASSPKTSVPSADVKAPTLAVAHNPAFDDLEHELRQPLSVIESLAYYLELTSNDERTCAHLRQIQDKVQEANGILARSRG
jgi:hypothetical protein